ncbi:RagB/SusD family nutrient uptake outer membrane protein [Sphingobacterium faecale]|uniref:RagB/SusD family nutrient uptake outer membrane protein n=1 Tax=Sphingobacterium faecale TaxID=2803775 RepID=A0ABS1R7Y3_9SPHI|nr:RagB/SusD family nutrient uptake outer membrane protein [Sphingobacterium faecale]MBL1410802.1 RagB/SusD family nutrient uptake outer membrane protein [Sphingobacterium faecale]
MMNKIYILVAVLLLQGCHSSFLDVKPSKQTIVPVTLEDYALLLNDENVVGRRDPISINFIGSDEFYLQDPIYASLPTQSINLFQKNAYTWEKEIYTGDEARTGWSDGYGTILNCNVVLDGLEKLHVASDQMAYFREVKGAALFIRAYNYYTLSQVYCDTYDSGTASQKLGLPLRKSADPTLTIPRASLQETYAFMISTLVEALDLLPPKRIQVTMVEPTQQAVHALLSRIYMQQGDYASAATHAEASLKIDSTLLDYADYDANALSPFPTWGYGVSEVIFYNNLTSVLIYGQPRMIVSQEFLDLYTEGDLRKGLFFTLIGTSTAFKGTYSGISGSWFSGLARDEVYLNLSESLARIGKVEESLFYLNRLRVKRIAKQVYSPFETSDPEALLRFILEERKRELYFRGTYWSDVRRLNKEARFQHSLQRVIGDKTYSLEPGSPRFTWPIPPDAIRNGGYVQNKR